jgi:hypothetical protein
MDRIAAARPDDPSVFAQRAEMNDRLGRAADTDADRRRALALGPDIATICDLAEEWAILGDWSMASNMFELAVERSRAGGTDAPSDSDTVSHHATTYLHNGDQGGYRRL